MRFIEALESIAPCEEDYIERIAIRAGELYRSHGQRVQKLNVRMALIHCHAVTPLRLADLLAADDGNFAHDVSGIMRHLDRDTGKLGECFVPRYAVQEG